MTPFRIAIFLTAVTTLSLLLHGFVWLRLVAPLSVGVWRTALTWTLVAGFLLQVTTPLVSRLGPAFIAMPAAWLGFTWMGSLFLAFMFTFAMEPVRWFVEWVWVRQGDPGVLESRRALLTGGISAVVGGTVAAMTVGGVARVLVKPRIVNLRVEIPRWPAALNGFRMVQLTDIHVSQTIRGDFVRMVVEETNRLQPDLVAITGDLVDGTVEELGAEVAPLAGLASKHGTYFVTGNHEYYSQVDGWLRFLPELGVRVLRNERVQVGEPGASFALAGVDDWTAQQFGPGHGADPDRAMGGHDVSQALILLAHQPKHIVDAVRLGVDLQLSGHTHGGQIWPFSHLVTLDQPYLKGLHRRGDTQIYISCGTGYWGPPMRVGAPPEITVIEFHAPA